MKRVLTFGEALLVFVPESAGPLADAQDFTLHVAGAELNTAVGLGRLEVPVAFGGAVGLDALGDKVVKTLRAEGVDTSVLERTDAVESPLFVKERVGLPLQTHVYYYRSGSPMAKGYWSGDPIVAALSGQDIGWVHTTGITWAVGDASRATARRVLEQSRHVGATISFDINMRLKMGGVEQWREILTDGARMADWMFLSHEEAELLLEENRVADVERILRSQGFAGHGVIIKSGERGAEVSVDGATESVSAWPAVVLDTVGAGDGFNAGWIAGMLRRYSTTEALRLAALVGAYAVTVAGDFDGYPTWSQAAKDLEGGSRKLR